MPSYVFVQCFTKYEESSFTTQVNNFKLVLNKLGFDEGYIKTQLSNIKWELSDNGFMYSGCNMPTEKVMIDNWQFKVRPLIMGFTPEGYEGLKENWIEYALLFDEEQVTKDYGTGEMLNSAKKPLWNTCNLLSEYFPEVIIYLTDEVTDTCPWEAILGLNKDFFSFDLAVVPNEYKNVYKEVPDGFWNKKIDNKVIIARKRVWECEPWDL